MTDMDVKKQLWNPVLITFLMVLLSQINAAEIGAAA